MKTFIASLALAGLIASCLTAERPTQEKSLEAVEKFLRDQNATHNADWGEKLRLLDENSIEKTFPSHRFFLLRFLQWPVARMTPPPLSSNNILAVDADGRVTLITDGAALFNLFKGGASVEEKNNTAAAWASLLKEIFEDGMFHLQARLDKIETRRTGKGVEVRVLVEPAPRGGNQGTLELSLDFDAGGKLLGHREQNNLKAGMRPICQSNQLTNPDIAVRNKAEQDILLMGRDALPYLHSRLDVVDPELRAKIEALIRRIDAGDAE